MKNKLIILIIGATIWTFFFTGLAGYSASKAFQEDPEIASKIGRQMGMTITSRNFQFGGMQGDYKDTRDTWSFSMPANNIQMRFFTADIEISASDKKEIEIIAHGGLDVNVAPHLIDTDFNGDDLMLSQPEGEAVKDLKVTIKVPKEYQQKVEIQSVNGDVYFLPMSLQNIKVRNVSGKVEGKNMSAANLEIETVSGDIDLEIKAINKAAIKTISGDVHLDMMSSKEKIDFDLSSVSGSISNDSGSDTSSSIKVIIKTVSGDIKIL